MVLPGFLSRPTSRSSFHTAHASLDNSIPLERVSRSSSSATSQKQLSKAATLGQRIHEDIDNGLYECGICIEKVRRDNTIWFCETCWNIYHRDCIKKCAAGRPNKSVAPGRHWKCPSCRAEYVGAPKSTCCRSQNPRSLFSHEHSDTVQGVGAKGRVLLRACV